MARAIKDKKIEVETFNMRQWAWNSYGAVDDRPFGGGAGMLIRVDVIAKALEELKVMKNRKSGKKTKIILTSAKGKKFNQARAERWSRMEKIVFICGRYEGFDQRIADNLVDEEISIGNYVLMGGELPALVMMEAVTRLLPGVLHNQESIRSESFSLDTSGEKRRRGAEAPQYTRPFEFEGMKVPEVFVSGNPSKIKEWNESRR